ncbi:ABC transporter permease [Streptomyces alkaliterrae]|uniref:ABC transporter permease n=1 Tax=Streptomyces alkaliterrae TaxID=2213162 RepID=A0A5P0YMY8_9ACTN|nr:ABC transporter permease [Streptomyces alkaliterrae]MBB1253912.1 ABC transporter permease [Streptomyces alkaliterrae]MBB1258186.1 ABC transporter permease [Streptomyces alkaliterrae]MQS01656.1 ABC transporter permease subunit [Streptomyces alkaliterrae]
MGRYVARRLLQMIPVFIGVTLLVFLMMYALPGDPVRALYGDQTIDPAQIAAIKADLGLDLPLWQQYWNYLMGLPQGDFGEQIATGLPVGEVIARALPITARLALLAFIIIVIVGIGLGMVAGLNAGRWPDTVVLFVTLIFISVPVFVLGYIYQYVFSNTLNWTSPLVTDSENLGELLMPAFVLASLSLAYVARLTRSSVAENRRADYMRTAIAKGLPQRRVLSVHLLRNSMIPVVTFLGVDIGTLMAGAVVTEGIFNINGIGSELFTALFRREGSTVVGLVTLIVIIYLAISLLVDLLYAVLDPRIRYA